MNYIKFYINHDLNSDLHFISNPISVTNTEDIYEMRFAARDDCEMRRDSPLGKSQKVFFFVTKRGDMENIFEDS